jgi:site-specific recombinase XerD
VNDLAPFIEFLEVKSVAKFDDVDRLFLREYLAWLISNGYDRSSVARKLSALKSFFRFLRHSGEIELDQTDLVTGPKKEKKLPAVASSFEIDRLLDEPNTSTDAGIRDRALLELLYGAGLRVSEVNASDVSDIDFEARELRVLGKGSKPRIALFGEQAGNWVDKYFSLVRPKFATRKSEPAIWLNQSGGRLSSRSIQRIVKKYALASQRICSTVVPTCVWFRIYLGTAVPQRLRYTPMFRLNRRGTCIWERIHERIENAKMNTLIRHLIRITREIYH